MVRVMEKIGDRLLSRFVPQVTAQAASCCGTCCFGVYRCYNHELQRLLTCRAESFEGCFIYSQQWIHQCSGCCV